MEKNVFFIWLLLFILFLNIITSLFYKDLYTLAGWVIAFIVTSRQLLIQFELNKMNRISENHNNSVNEDKQNKKTKK